MGTTSRPPIARRSPPALQIRLLGAFALEVRGRDVSLPHGPQRILAFLALRPHALQRNFMAESLWLDAGDARAAANLRSALWRIRHVEPSILAKGHGTLRLDSAVAVDVRDAYDVAMRWLAGQPTIQDVAEGTTLLNAEILPDWYDDWVLDERDRFRQVRLRALEAMAEWLIDVGRIGEALLAALAATREDPFRESAQRALIKVHIAEGNTGEAVKQLRRCEQLFERELGLRPSRGLTDLVREAVTASR